MVKTIMITGATDGIGLQAAKLLAKEGHHLILHGRNEAKLNAAQDEVAKVASNDALKTYLADLSNLDATQAMADQILQDYDHLDVLINNAGILKAANTLNDQGQDIRFVVNTLAPYLLTTKLLPIMSKASDGSRSRIINLSSAAQNAVDLDALKGKVTGLADMEAYAQSKLAITMWSREMAKSFGDDGPIVIPVNPGSLLASKMVKEGFGLAGKDIMIGADILRRLSIDPEFEDKSGQYFDNDQGHFGRPHEDALNPQLSRYVTETVKQLVL